MKKSYRALKKRLKRDCMSPKVKVEFPNLRIKNELYTSIFVVPTIWKATQIKRLLDEPHTAQKHWRGVRQENRRVREYRRQNINRPTKNDPNTKNE